MTGAAGPPSAGRWRPPAVPLVVERLARRILRPLLVHSEQAAIVASSADAIVGCDRAGRISSWNPAAERLFGYPAADAVGRPVTMVMVPERRATGLDVLERVWAGERVGVYETQALRRDGSTVDVAVLVSPILRRGRVVGVVTGARDLSGKRLAELALRRGEERFRAVVESARNAFVGMDDSGRITDWNRRAEELFGWPRNEAIGQRLDETIVPPLHRPAFKEGVRRLLTPEAGSIIGRPIELTAQRRDGTTLPVEVSAWQIEEGDRPSFYAFIQDISERKRAEELQSRVAAIVESSDEAIVGFDTDLVVTHWNTGAERLYGYPAAEAVGRPVGFLLPGGPDTRSTLLEGVAAGGRISDAETRVRTRDGRVVPISLSASPILDPAGRITGVSSVAHDVTERREFRAALAAARDEALETSRLKSHFLATMSHEIRTPMNGVIGLTGLLLDTELAPLQRRYAEGIHNAGEALLAVINDILDFSKIEAGHLELEAVDFDLAPLVEDVTALVAEGARDKGLEILVSCDPDLPDRVRGDANRIRQVLLNLVGNAVKFTPKGEVVVLAERAGGEEATPHVRFEVVDSGIGIPPGRRADLFQPFSQADASTTRRYGGTGLGLAISAQLVEAMGGTIGFESEEGQGSRFWFTLPLETRPESSPALPGSNLLRDIPVLVADDNETNRLILHTQLEAWGLQPYEVVSGRDALTRLAAAAAVGTPYRVLIVDHQMPGMDGLDVARRVAADPVLAGTPVLLLTSGGEVSADAAEEAHLAARLTKPVRQSDLCDFLLRAVAGVGRPSDTPAAPAVPEAAVRGRVLVAEDNEVNQMVALGILAKLGYEAQVAVNGAEAIAAFAACGYDAVLMDCHMPEVDGYEATAEIRAREKDKPSRTPIIAMTAGVLVEDRERALAAGMDDYVAKPIEVETLEAALDRWVPDRRPRRRHPSPAGPAPGGATGDSAAAGGSVVTGDSVGAGASAAATDSAGAGDSVAGDSVAGDSAAAGDSVAGDSVAADSVAADSAGSADSAPLDDDRLDMLRRLGPPGGQGLLPQLARSFLAEAPELARAVHDGLDGRDAAALRQAAHRLRGSAANVGAHLVAGVCTEIEAAATEELNGAEAAVERLDGELDRALQALSPLARS